jgi:hemolysin activation/secretion protein
LRQQIEGNRAVELPKRVLPAEVPAATVQTPSKAEAEVIQVKRFRFSGNSLLGSQDFEQLVLQHAGKAWSVGQLRDVLAPQIAELYRLRGWVVSVVLQEPAGLAGGEVVFNIIQARTGQLVFEGGVPQRVDKDHILEVFHRQLISKEHLNNKDVDRAVLLSNALPGVTVMARQRAGQVQGETDVVVTAQDKPAFAGDVALDNMGARANGAERLMGNLEWRSPTGAADALALSMVHTQGSDYSRLGYTLPIAYDGLRLGANVTHLRYEVIAPELRALGVQGSSKSAGLEFNYPMVRAYDRNLYLSGNFDRKSYDNRTLAAGTTSQYEIQTFAPSLMGNAFDDFAGGGTSMASLTLTRGRVKLDGSPNQVTDLATANTQGMFTKLRYSLSRQQNITSAMSVSASYTAQISNKNLDSSEKIYLGGSSGVRAYPTGEAGGSEGQLVNLEVKFQLGGGYEAAAFYDKGHVNQYRNTQFTGAPANNSLFLQGYGLSLNWRGTDGLNIKGTWARRNGVNPNPTATGQDQDGSLNIHRLWLTAAYAF